MCVHTFICLQDHSDGSLPFHRLTNALKTIEKPSGAMVTRPKTIVKPLEPMVGGAIENPFQGLTNGYLASKTIEKPLITMIHQQNH